MVWIVKQLLRSLLCLKTEEDVCSHLTGRRFRTGHWPSCRIGVSGLKGFTHSFLNMMLVEVVII